MPGDDRNNNDFSGLWELLNEYSVLIALIIAGAVAHVLVTIQQAREQDERLAWIDLGVRFGISMFSGLIFVMAAQTVGAEGIQLGLAGSIGAFLGLNGLNWLTDRFLEKLKQEGKN